MVSRWAGGDAHGGRQRDQVADRTPKRSASTWSASGSGTAARCTTHTSVVCLAGGPLQSPRLWLESRLPNPNGWVGAGLTDHYLDFLVGVMADDVGGALGAASAARADWPGYGGIENVCAGPAQQALSLTYSDQGVSGYYDNGGQAALHGADTVGRLVGPDLLDRVGDVNRLLSVVIITDDDVEQQNRVTLSTSADQLGRRPRVVINHRNQAREDAAQPGVPRGPSGRDPPGCRRHVGPPQQLAAHGPARPFHDEDGGRSVELGDLANRRDLGGRGAVRHRQLGAVQLARRPQPDPDHPSGRHPDRREHHDDPLRR